MMDDLDTDLMPELERIASRQGGVIRLEDVVPLGCSALLWESLCVTPEPELPPGTRELEVGDFARRLAAVQERMRLRWH